MKKTMTKFLIGSTMLFLFQSFGQQTMTEPMEKTITPEDLEIGIGDWSGSLTYIDYSSNKPYTMPANLRVEQGKNEKQLVLFYTYPNEPKANSKEKITISKNGSILNKRTVKSKQKISDQQVKITTEHSGKDNNMEALIRNIFILGENTFIIRKEVRFSAAGEWLLRNEYNFKR
jgi:hypothetical protein